MRSHGAQFVFEKTVARQAKSSEISEGRLQHQTGVRLLRVRRNTDEPVRFYGLISMQSLNEAGYEAYRSDGLAASSTVALWVYPSGRGLFRQNAC